MTVLNVTLQTVKTTRLQRDRLQADLAVVETAFREANAALLAEVDRLRHETRAVEAELRHLAAEHFGETGDKHPAPGVNVRVRQTVEFDETEALAWARQHNVALLLNRDLFAKVAKAHRDAGTPLAFVEHNEEIIGTLAPTLP